MNSKRWNNVILLSLSQALYATTSILVMTLSGLVGLELASDKSMATLPIALISVGAATMMVPASLIIKKLGQRKGFLVGTTIGMTAGLLAFYAILQHSFPLFVMANMLVGCYQGFAQYYRFAAADSVSEKHKGKAISFVLAGGVIAAVAGPTLAKYTQDIGEVPFAWSYLSIALLSVLAMVFIFSLRLKRTVLPDETNTENQKRPLRVIARQKNTITALISSSVGYSVMILVMTATPLAMKSHGHSLDDSATVIQWHVLGMFVPSFFTGILIEKFGTIKIVVAGIIIFSIHVMLALMGTEFLNFISGLILLGIGWNFMYVGGSTLLTKVYRPEEKEKTQALHDFLVFVITSLSSFLAGNLLNRWGWLGINIAVIPLLAIALLRIVFFNNNRKSQLFPAKTMRE